MIIFQKFHQFVLPVTTPRLPGAGPKTTLFPVTIRVIKRLHFLFSTGMEDMKMVFNGCFDFHTFNYR